MKFTNSKKIAVVTMATTMMSTVANATESQSGALARDLGDWGTLVCEILSVLLLVVFAMYMGRFFSIKTDKDAENDEKVLPGVRNGMMTSLVGIAILQAAIIIFKRCF